MKCIRKHKLFSSNSTKYRYSYLCGFDYDNEWYYDNINLYCNKFRQFYTVDSETIGGIVFSITSKEHALLFDIKYGHLFI